MTKVINLFGGSGTGKSTLAAGLFYAMKTRNISCELISEVAKGYTWAAHHNKLQCQPLVFGRQLWRMERLLDKVDYIITDSPILLSIIYHSGRYGESWDRVVQDTFDLFNNINFVVKRTKPFIQAGRNETESQAKEIDSHIIHLLCENDNYYTVVESSDSGIKQILEEIGVN